MTRYSNSMIYVELDWLMINMEWAHAANTQFLHTSYLFTRYCRRSIDFAWSAFSNTTHCNSTSVVYFPGQQSTHGPGSLPESANGPWGKKWVVYELPGQSAYWQGGWAVGEQQLHRLVKGNASMAAARAPSATRTASWRHMFTEPLNTVQHGRCSIKNFSGLSKF